MGICYSDDAYTGPLVPFHRQNATAAYLRHLENALYLTFLQQNSRDAREKAQCGRELTRAEAGMERARRHPNYDPAVADPAAAAARKKWRSGR